MKREQIHGLSVQLRLFNYPIGRAIIEGAFETYKPTIEELKSTSDELTAQEVSNITRRARNTEAIYLKKFQRAGFTEKNVKKGKACYKLINEENLPVVFGNR